MTEYLVLINCTICTCTVNTNVLHGPSKYHDLRESTTDVEDSSSCTVCHTPFGTVAVVLFSTSHKRRAIVLTSFLPPRIREIVL